MAIRIQLRKDHPNVWDSADPTLAAGEFGFAWDSADSASFGRLKIGDGSTSWTNLPYFYSAGDSAGNYVIPVSTDISFDIQNGIASASTNSYDYNYNDITLSGNSAISTNTLRDGAYYFEIELLTGGGATNYGFVGVSRSNQSSPGYNVAGTLQTYLYNGLVYPGGQTGIGTVANNDIVQIAYNNQTDEVWFGKNNTTWAPGDPASVQGFTLGGTSQLTVKMSLGSGSYGGAQHSANILVGSNLNYSPPTGFTAH